MTANDRHYWLNFEDIELSMTRLLKYGQGIDFLKFKQSSIRVDAVFRNFEIIGEAAKNVPEISFV